MKKSEIQFLSLILVVGIIVAATVWVLQKLNPQIIETVTPSAFNPKTVLASFYERVEVSVEPRAPQYALPLDLATVTNFNEVQSEFPLSERQVSVLRGNGFVAIPLGHENDMVEVYKDLKNRDIPIFVTSDSLLHLYHIQFNETLKEIEENEFFGKIKAMSKAMLDDSISKHDSLDGDLKEAARKNVAYFAVGLSLLDPGANIPTIIASEVAAELQLIEQHSGFADSPIFKYSEDYSQYVPRGHYTRSEVLKRYFKAMMWYGRMAFLLKGGQNPPFDALVSEEDAIIQTMQSALIASSMDRIRADNASVGDLWGRIYAVTSFFVGVADDLTPYEYKDAIREVFGETFDARELSNDNNMLSLKVVLAKMRSPEIYGGTGEIWIEPPITPEKLNEVLDKSKGMRFMGQRYVPDSYMFQNLVAPAVGEFTGNGTPFTLAMAGAGPYRCFPRGLDVMAVLGSGRALEILQEEGDAAYENYDNKLNELREKFAAFNENDWNRNLYWSWLYTLKALLVENSENHPTFMQTQAWQDKQLNTALASWAELRHDTILYAKQSYTPGTGLPPRPPGYVEPVPEFYARMLALTKMTRTGLTELGALSQASSVRLQNLENILNRLLGIAGKELENEELGEDDYEFIRNFGESAAQTVEGVESEGKETTVIADVHTDINTGKVLEEGVGYVDLILVACKVLDGRIILGAGPVFSYYEFTHPMDGRLTDEKWVEMLNSNPPERQKWSENFCVSS